MASNTVIQPKETPYYATFVSNCTVRGKQLMEMTIEFKNEEEFDEFNEALDKGEFFQEQINALKTNPDVEYLVEEVVECDQTFTERPNTSNIIKL
jgi:hypothetical protein